MSIPYWPADLPQRFLREPFGLTLPDGRLTTKMERGPAKRRRASSAAVAPVTAAIDVPIDLAVRFRRFWDVDTGGGVLPFLLPDQMADKRPLIAASGVPVLDANGAPLLITSWWLITFAGDAGPSYKNTAGFWWRISFQLEILP